MSRRPGSKTTALEITDGLELGDRHFLITGPSAGIGLETARALAAAGATCHLACRSRARFEETEAALRTTHPRASLRPFLVDLGDLTQVREAARRYDGGRLDALIANAGVFGGGYQATAQGLERTVGICHFAHFLLVRELLPVMTATARAQGEARVVLVASESHRSPRRLDLERLPLAAADYSDLVAYGQAKLCNVLHARGLQRRFASDGLVAVSLHPGALVSTSIGRSSLLARVAIALARPFTKSVEQAAATTAFCVTSAAVEPGGYHRDCRPTPASPEGRSDDVADRLWLRTEAALAGLGFAPAELS